MLKYGADAARGSACVQVSLTEVALSGESIHCNKCQASWCYLVASLQGCYKVLPVVDVGWGRAETRPCVSRGWGGEGVGRGWGGWGVGRSGKGTSGWMSVQLNVQQEF